ncbi:hypothetical protein BC833DRAFT_579711 [Globomyces pollinis-pini]|nr:hypothetical protein BC833DRAFT_579711 [Globomyces pollinis-pini]
MRLHRIPGKLKSHIIVFQGRYSSVLNEYVSNEKYDSIVNDLNAIVQKFKYPWFIRNFSFVLMTVVFGGIALTVLAWHINYGFFLMYPAWILVEFIEEQFFKNIRNKIKRAGENYSAELTSQYADTDLSFSFTEQKVLDTFFLEFIVPGDDVIFTGDLEQEELEYLPAYEEPPVYTDTATERDVGAVEQQDNTEEGTSVTITADTMVHSPTINPDHLTLNIPDVDNIPTEPAPSYEVIMSSVLEPAVPEIEYQTIEMVVAPTTANIISESSNEVSSASNVVSESSNTVLDSSNVVVSEPSNVVLETSNVVSEIAQSVDEHINVTQGQLQENQTNEVSIPIEADFEASNLNPSESIINAVPESDLSDRNHSVEDSSLRVESDADRNVR